MFPRINIEKENKMAQESEEVLDRMIKESYAIYKISLITLIFGVAIAFIVLCVTGELNSFLLVCFALLLISTLLNLGSSLRRLGELKKIAESH